MSDNSTEPPFTLDDLSHAVDVVWLFLTGVAILSMQLGFAMLESGSVRSRNVKSVILKNLGDGAIGSLAWYLVGNGLYTGDDAIAAGDGAQFLISDASDMAVFMQQAGFALTAITIVSGAIAERALFGPYIVYSAYLTGVVYAICAHAGWGSNGWLGGLGYQDFAGSGIVHALGGICAFVYAWLVGPRVDRFSSLEEDDDENFTVEFSNPGATPRLENQTSIEMPKRGEDGSPPGSSRSRPRTRSMLPTMPSRPKRKRIWVNQLKGYDPAQAAFGAIFLYLGWFSFNAGSTVGMSYHGAADTAARAAVNTFMAAGAAVVTGMLWSHFVLKTNNLGFITNCLLGGLAAVTAPCGNCDVWAGVLAGVLSVPVYAGCSKLMIDILRIDDALDAFAVHYGCGALGVILTGFVSLDGGLFYSGTFDLLGAQLLGIGAITAWGMVASLAYLVPVKLFWGITVSEDGQIAGLDIFHFDGFAFAGDFDMTAAREQMAIREAQIRLLRRRKTQLLGVGDFRVSGKSPNFRGMRKAGHGPKGMRTLNIPGILEACLADAVTRGQLRSFLEQSHEAEPVAFIERLVEFESEKKPASRAQAARAIIQEFVLDTAAHQINLRSETRRQLGAALLEGSDMLAMPGLFMEAKLEVIKDVASRPNVETFLRLFVDRKVREMESAASSQHSSHASDNASRTAPRSLGHRKVDVVDEGDEEAGSVRSPDVSPDGSVTVEGDEEEARL